MFAPTIASLYNLRAVETTHIAYDIESISVMYKSQLIGISPNLHSTVVFCHQPLRPNLVYEATCRCTAVGKVHSEHVAVRHR